MKFSLFLPFFTPRSIRLLSDVYILREKSILIFIIRLPPSCEKSPRAFTDIVKEKHKTSYQFDFTLLSAPWKLILKIISQPKIVNKLKKHEME